MKRNGRNGFCYVVFFLCLLAIGNRNAATGNEPVNSPSHPPLDIILQRIENRYAGTGFSANFEQLSTIKMLDITDTASGRLYVKRPGKMRWIYEEPDRQIIITDGMKLWIYKPDDLQVMIGNYPAFFGDGKGASFLSDMKLIREKFHITFETQDPEGNYRLKLLPGEKEIEISSIYLLISGKNFDVIQITTYNVDGDETRIILKDIQFEEKMDDGLFHFEINSTLDVLQLDE